jgi:hypothetical protein
MGAIVAGNRTKRDMSRRSSLVARRSSLALALAIAACGVG